MALELNYRIPGQETRKVLLDQPTMMVGTLLSNQVVVRAPGVDPIHAVIEQMDDDSWVVTDVGSAAGIKVNGELVNVEVMLKAGDKISVGSVTIDVGAAVDVPDEAVAATVPSPVEPDAEPTKAAATKPHKTRKVSDKTRKVSDKTKRERRVPSAARVTRPEVALEKARKDVLFSPRKARPSGDVLECVAYWGDTVLEVELFHPTIKGFERVTIGDPTKAHFIAAGKAHFDRFTLASVRDRGYKLYLKSGMSARLRKGGKVEKVESGSFTMGSRDIAHIKYGAVRYFMLFVRPPALKLPKTGVKDPFFVGLMAFALLFYMMLMPVAWMYDPPKKDDEKDDIWSIVQVPEKEKPTPRPQPVKKQKIAQKKKPPVKKKPPPPKPKPVKPAKPIEKEKPKQSKPVTKPVPKKMSTKVLTANKTKTPKRPSPVTKDAKKKPGKPGTKGMPSSGFKKPDFKLAGPKLKGVKLGAAGGPRGSGMKQKGGARKGKGRFSVMGVEGVNNNKASGVNLSKLGLGVGKIMNKTGAGAIHTNFKSSAGGAGGGSGHASKTYGLGGVGSGKSLGIAGAGGGLNQWGSGSGGILSGQGGSGGYGGSGLGKGFGSGRGGSSGRGRANVSVPPGDPVVSGGLTPQEIMAVIRANLNQIRHCYEQLLQRSPNASGRMGVRFVVGTNGRVSSVSVSNATIRDSRMRGCVTGAVRRWPFPKPRGGRPVTVNYPFIFNPL